MKKRQVIKRGFEERGETIADWARAHGYSLRTVYAVLGGQLLGKRGIGHKIAVELGIKKRPEVA